MATSRGSKTLGLEDLLFLMRHSPVKVTQIFRIFVCSRGLEIVMNHRPIFLGAEVSEVLDCP